MKREIFCVIPLLLCGLAMADEPEGTVPKGQMLSDLYWNSYTNDQLHVGGHPATPDAPPLTKMDFDSPIDPAHPETISLRITYLGSGPLQLKLLPAEHYENLGNGYPRLVTTHHYAITGEVRYENVSAGSYLEMWSHFDPPAPKYPGEPGSPFPDEAYFTRTLADNGPMGRLDGTSDWREFWLPFDSTGAKTQLTELEMNLHLTGPGTVHLRNMKLMQYPDAPPAAAQPQSGSEGQVVLELSQKNASTMVSPVAGEPTVMEIFGSLLPSWQIWDPKITATHYAVTGEIRYENVSNGYLQMFNAFAPEDPGGPSTWFYTRTLADQGPLARLKGTSDWRPFWLPFDSSKVKTRLTRIGISLLMADEGKVYLRNVKLVQYPSGLFPPSPALSGTNLQIYLPSGEPAFQDQPAPAQQQISSAQAPRSSKAVSTLDWKSFLLGVVATGIALFGTWTLVFLWRRGQRRQHERELRRIASLDG
jgi:hypothetical protein